MIAQRFHASLIALFVSAALMLPGSAADAQAPPRDGQSPLRAYVEENAYRQAYGVYLAGNKVGWLIEEMKLGMHSGQQVAVTKTDGKFVIRFLGEESVMQLQSETLFSLKGEGEILHATEKLVEDESTTEFLITREGQELLLLVKSGGQETRRRIGNPKTNLAQQLRLDEWLAGPREQGDSFESFTTAWDEADVDVLQRFTFQQQRTIAWGGVPTKAYLVTVKMRGVDTQATVGAGGRILEGKMAGLFEIRAEKEAVAKELSGEAIDMMAASAVKIDKPLGDTETLVSLTLRIEGLKGHKLPTSHRQSLEHSDGGDVVLKLRRDFRTPQPKPLDEDQRKKSLQSTPVFPADHQTIRDLAQEILNETEDAAEAPVLAAKGLSDWVHNNLRQTYSANASTALQVLENRAGDCTEHAILFVTLARAAGIPAREVSGLAYVGDDAQLFGWHSWAEIHDGQQWVTVDPTWQQVYVDPSHIKVAQDYEDWSWVNVITGLELKVLALKRDE